MNYKPFLKLWEEDEPEDNMSDTEEDGTNSAASRTGDEVAQSGGMTSQLRHFIAQPYIDPPLLLKSPHDRKFHIRTYVLAVGALKVYVYREMLALFAAKTYRSPASTAHVDALDLSQHLTNTCFQDEDTKESSVFRFWDLDSSGMKPEWQEEVFRQICNISGEVFEAAAREQIIHFQPVPNAFELFGVDFLVDGDYNVWLLELNAYPDFRQTGSGLQEAVVGGLFKEVAKAAIAPFCGLPATKSVQMPLVRSIELGRQ